MNNHLLTLNGLSQAELKRIQARQLSRYLTEVIAPFHPFYKRLFSEHEIDPRKIQSVADLRHLPFTTKRDLLPTDESPERFREFVITPDIPFIRSQFSVIIEGVLRGREHVRRRIEREFRPIFLTATTGRSSAPVSFVYTDHDLQNLRVAGHRLIEQFGGNAGDRAVNMFPYAPHLAFWQVVFAGLEFGQLIVSTGGGKVMGTEGCIRAVDKLQPAAIIGVPTFLYHVVRLAHEQGKRWPTVNKVVLGGEKSPAGIRRKFKALLQDMGAKEVDFLGTYGFTEAKMAWGQCPAPLEAPASYHLYPDKEIFEVINPDTGEPVAEGERGELVYTPIDARGTVVLRYRTGDIVEGGVTWEPCPHCRRVVPRIVGNISRASNIADLQFSKVRGTLVDLNELEHVLDDEPALAEWQIELRKVNDDPLELDEVVLHITPTDGQNVDKLKARLAVRLREATELTPNRIEVHPIEEMARRLGLETSLKHKRILDVRAK